MNCKWRRELLGADRDARMQGREGRGKVKKGKNV